MGSHFSSINLDTWNFHFRVPYQIIPEKIFNGYYMDVDCNLGTCPSIVLRLMADVLYSAFHPFLWVYKTAVGQRRQGNYDSHCNKSYHLWGLDFLHCIGWTLAMKRNSSIAVHPPTQCLRNGGGTCCIKALSSFNVTFRGTGRGFERHHCRNTNVVANWVGSVDSDM